MSCIHLLLEGGSMTGMLITWSFDVSMMVIVVLREHGRIIVYGGTFLTVSLSRLCHIIMT